MENNKIKHLIFLLIFIGLLLTSILVCRYFEKKDDTFCKNLGYDEAYGQSCIKKVQTEPGLFKTVWSKGEFEMNEVEELIFAFFSGLGFMSVIGMIYNFFGLMGRKVTMRD